MTPRVSLCVPTIGRARYLRAVRHAVESQTFRDVEILVLDNASPPEVVREHFEPWARDDSRVRLLRVEERVPMFTNFNRGIAAARAPYVVFFHDDDVQHPSLIERSVEVLDRDDKVSFVGTNYDFIDDAGTITERRRWIRGDAIEVGEDYIRDLVRRGRNKVPMPGIVFRRDGIAEGFDVSLPIHFGDFTLLMRLAERHRVGLLADALIQIRRHEGQASGSMPLSRSLPLRASVLHAYLDELAARGVLPEKEIAGLRRRVTLQERLSMAYGWYLADDPAEVTACAAGCARRSRTLGVGLRFLDASGLRRRAKEVDVRSIVKRLAPRVGL